MEDEFKTLLLAGCPFALLKWMRAQELQPLLRLVKRPKFLAAENSEMPGLFYLAYHLGLGRNYKEEELEVVRNLVKIFLLAGCDLEEKTVSEMTWLRCRKEVTPLLAAIRMRKFPFAYVLVEMGADVKAKDRDGLTPLHLLCAHSDDVKLARLMVEKGALLVDKGMVPVLHVAVKEERIGLLRYFLRIKGVDPNPTFSYKVLTEKHWISKEQNHRYNCGDSSAYSEQVSISAVGQAVRMRKLTALNFLLADPRQKASLSDLHYCILEGDSEVANKIVGRIDPRLLATGKVKGTDIPILHRLGSNAFLDTNAEATKKLICRYLASGFWAKGLHEFLPQQFVYSYMFDRNNWRRAAHLLLDSGFLAVGYELVRSNECLNCVSKILEDLDLVAKFWWAGGSVNFSLLKLALKHEGTPLPLSEPARKRLENAIKPMEDNNLSLRRLSAIAVRKSCNLREELDPSEYKLVHQLVLQPKY